MPTFLPVFGAAPTLPSRNLFDPWIAAWQIGSEASRSHDGLCAVRNSEVSGGRRNRGSSLQGCVVVSTTVADTQSLHRLCVGLNVKRTPGADWSRTFAAVEYYARERHTE